MSWFDSSSFSSFAKTAFSQAQNLQKSIDRVLDIKEESTDAASRSSASSKQKSALSSESSGSSKETSVTRKSPSASLSATTASKSSRKSPPVIVNSTENDNAEGNSFWSSFLGDSFPSTAKNIDSKPSSRRTAGRKSGAGVSGPTAGRKVRNSDDNKNAHSKKTTTDSDGGLLSQELKQIESDATDISNATKMQRHLPVSNSHSFKEEEIGKVTEDVCTNNVDSATSKGEEDILPSFECGSQDSGVTPVEISDGSEIKKCHLKLSSVNKCEEPGALGNNSSSLLNTSVKARSTDLEKEEELAPVSKEFLSVVEAQNEICNMETVDSSAVLHPEVSQSTINVERISSQNIEETNNKGIDNSVRLHGPPVKDSEVSLAVTGDEALLELPTESADQYRLHKVNPLASSTPIYFSNKQSDKERKLDETLSVGSGEYRDELDRNEGVVDITCSDVGKGNPGMETEIVVDAVSVEQDEYSEEIIPQNQPEASSEEAEKRYSSRINESAVMQEDTEEMEKDPADSTVGLQRKIKELQNEVNNLKHVVDVRESKLVELSKENVDLQETDSILRSQLKQAEAALKAEDEEIDDVRQEFTVRVAATENKFQVAAKERDKLKALLEETEKSLNCRNERQCEEFTTLLKEKDDQIAQLLEEGEKLSKQELQVNNTVKKLRAKEKENEALIKKNSKELEELTSENARLNEILKLTEETERKQTDAITQLNTYVEKQEEKVSKLNSEADDANEKMRSMQTALDNAYKQLADLHKENASKDSAVQEAALSAEMNAKEGLRIAMDKQERQFKKEIETLEFQISDLQSSLRRGEQQANRREDNLRQENGDLQQRLQEAEARNQELTESVTHATRPLLRQIENLQSSYGNHTQTWERVERNLTERLGEAQIQLADAQEKERVATEHALELRSRLTTVESQIVTYRQDKSRLEAALELERARLDTAEDARSREAAKIEALEVKYRKMMEDNNVEKALLEQQLAVEKSKMETEKKRFQNTMDEKERILLRQSSLSGIPPSPSAASEVSQDEFPEASPHRTHARQSSSGSIIDGISRGIMAGSTAMVERLQAQVKQKDGEIELLQEEIASLQKTRDSFTEELTNVTSRMENLERDSQLLAELRTRYRELEQRHNAVLQMYGEKAEECEELRMDLEDVKSMYKSQIQEFLGASR